MSKTMNAKRTEFIEKIWTKYPEAPRQLLKWGRVHQQRCGMQSVSSHKPVESDELTGSDILVDGDLIGLLPAGKFVLLAPNLSDRPMNLSVEADPWTRHKGWLEFLQFIEMFFLDKKFLRGRSPVLTDCPGTEPSLDVFVSHFQIGSKVKKYFLSTSPELHLKKLLSLGAEKLFEIAPVFRNGEQTDRHHFEFLMLEWYRAFAPLSSIKHDVIELFERSAEFLKVSPPKEVLTFSIPELFNNYLQFDLRPNTGIEELTTLAKKHNIDVSAAQVVDDYFYLIFTDKIENKWPQDRLVFIEKYPPYQAALARIGTDGWAERFEVYYHGLEIGNAFHELNDPVLQRQRTMDDLKKKALLQKEPVGVDEEFLYALDCGLPPSSGIAIGLERLFMSMKGLKDIHHLRELVKIS
jgi:elongation factor P--(R)-beta-lysine ligase